MEFISKFKDTDLRQPGHWKIKNMQTLENILQGYGEPQVSMTNACFWKLCEVFNKGQ